jgi:phage-related protein
MSRWDIDPHGVNSVVNKTGQVARGFEGAVKSYATGLQDGANNSGSQIVAEAIKGFAEHHEKTFDSILNRVVNVLTGAANATKAYLEGDLQMAQEAQRNASR